MLDKWDVYNLGFIFNINKFVYCWEFGGVVINFLVNFIWKVFLNYILVILLFFFGIRDEYILLFYWLDDKLKEYY